MQYSRGPPTIEDSASSSRSPYEPFKIDFWGTKSERNKNIWKRLVPIPPVLHTTSNN